MALPRAPEPPAVRADSSMTLRALLDARRAEGRRMSLAEATAVLVPVCLDLQERHARGERLFVHPSAIAPGADGIARVEPRIANAPSHPFDRHCLAPELQRSPQPGDACASVYSVGAMLYEMVTGLHIGPAMKRPRDIDPTVPESFEILVGKAIIGDRAHRPADLGALASALYGIAPQRSMHPPAVSAGALDASAELEVDVPPSEIASRYPASNGVAAVPGSQRPPPSGDPFAAPIIDRTAVASSRRSVEDPTAKLAALKARLESDPRPRYVVNKDMMDHGPFSAVELLQQIASHAFNADDGLRDEISGQQLPLGEWEEFAPFAEQAQRLRDKRAEDRAVVRAADADKKSGIAKTILAVSVVVALGGVLAVWYRQHRGTRSDTVVVSKDRAGTIEIEGDIKGKKRAAAAGHGGGGGYAGGQSYEAVLNSNNESVVMGEAAGAPDLTNAQLAGPLRHAGFIPSCGAPDDMKVQVRVAVRMGVPIGVTVATTPPNGGIAGCIDRAVRGLRWPPSGKTDFVTTNY